jgi:putative phosphoesterase
MRLAVVSDIHGNRRAFDAVLRDLKNVSPDAIVHGGDLVANGAHPSDIVDEVRSFGWTGVRGNTDEMLCRPDTLSDVRARHPRLSPILHAFEDMIPATIARLGDDRLRWLDALPVRLTVEDVTVMHASPTDLWRAPLDTAPDEDLRAMYADLRSRFVIYGHIHRPYVRALDTLTIANTGSISLSYDGDRRASYLLVDQEQVRIRRVEYDWEREATDLEHSWLPGADWLGRILRSGRYEPPVSLG